MTIDRLPTPEQIRRKLDHAHARKRDADRVLAEAEALHDSAKLAAKEAEADVDALMIELDKLLPLAPEELSFLQRVAAVDALFLAPLPYPAIDLEVFGFVTLNPSTGPTVTDHCRPCMVAITPAGRAKLAGTYPRILPEHAPPARKHDPSLEPPKGDP